MQLLSNTLKTAEDLHKNVPAIKNALEQTKWQRDVICTMPDEVKKEITDEYVSEISEALTFSSRIFQPLENLSLTNVSSLSAVVVSDSSAAYNTVIMFGNSASPSVSEWAVAHQKSYQVLQEKQERVTATKQLLGSLSLKVANEFGEATESVKYATTTTGDIQGAAIKLRNVLEHLRGELFERAIQRPREQKIKWTEMAERLAKGGSSGIECKRLLSEENKYKSLHSDLTNVAKNLKVITKGNLENLNTEVVDHVYTIITLINLNKLKKRTEPFK